MQDNYVNIADLSDIQHMAIKQEPSLTELSVPSSVMAFKKDKITPKNTSLEPINERSCRAQTTLGMIEQDHHKPSVQENVENIY